MVFYYFLKRWMLFYYSFNFFSFIMTKVFDYVFGPLWIHRFVFCLLTHWFIYLFDCLFTSYSIYLLEFYYLCIFELIQLFIYLLIYVIIKLYISFFYLNDGLNMFLGCAKSNVFKNEFCLNKVYRQGRNLSWLLFEMSLYIYPWSLSYKCQAERLI